MGTLRLMPETTGRLRPQVPPSRWDADVGWPGEAGLPKRFGSWVEGAELFDFAFFSLSLREASGVAGGSNGWLGLRACRAGR